MSYGAKYEFRNMKLRDSTYRDGTVVPRLSIEVWVDGVYRGYADLHTHRVKDDSISLGLTARWETRRKP